MFVWAGWVMAGILGTFVLTPCVRFLACRLNIMDCPDGKRKLHRQPVPLLGGVGLYLTMMLGNVVLCWLHSGTLNAETFIMLLSGAMLVGLGVADDVWVLRPRWKFLGQILCVLPMIVFGYSLQQISIFGYSIALGSVGPIVTVVWLVACINALNLIDGVDGLASSIGAVVAIVLALIGWQTGAYGSALEACLLAGALTGFLFYNAAPARIYLGDSGSMGIGLMVGFLTLRVARSSDTVLATPALLALAVPLLDILLAVLRRSLKGQAFWHADRGHLHHVLLERGLRPGQVACFVAGLGAVTGLLAWSSVAGWTETLAWIFALSFFVMLGRKQYVGHREWLNLKEAAAGGYRLALGRLMALRSSSNLNGNLLLPISAMRRPEHGLNMRSTRPELVEA